MAAARPAAVGGFVLGALVLAVAVILTFGGSRLFGHTTQAVIFFEGSVAGLNLGAPVTFRGVPVGSVQRMTLQLSSAGQARVPVTIELEPDRVTVDGVTPRTGQTSLQQLVAAGLRAQLALQSFVTGQLRVDLDFLPGTPAERATADTNGLPQIPALPSDLERLRTTLAELPLKDLAQSSQRVLLTVEHLAARLDTELGPLLDSTRHSIETATRTLDSIERAVASLEPQLSRSLREFDQLAVDTRRQLSSRGTELAQLLGSADRAARRAEALLASLDSLTASRSQLRGDLEATMRDLAATAASLRDFGRAIERDPSTLLRGRNTR